MKVFSMLSVLSFTMYKTPVAMKALSGSSGRGMISLTLAGNDMMLEGVVFVSKSSAKTSKTCIFFTEKRFRMIFVVFVICLPKP